MSSSLIPPTFGKRKKRTLGKPAKQRRRKKPKKKRQEEEEDDPDDVFLQPGPRPQRPIRSGRQRKQDRAVRKRIRQFERIDKQFPWSAIQRLGYRFGVQKISKDTKTALDIIIRDTYQFILRRAYVYTQYRGTNRISLNDINAGGDLAVRTLAVLQRDSGAHRSCKASVPIPARARRSDRSAQMKVNHFTNNQSQCLIFAPARFKRFVKDFGRDLNAQMSFSKDALVRLQQLTEAIVGQIMQISYSITRNCRRKIMNRRDLKTGHDIYNQYALKIRDITGVSDRPVAPRRRRGPRRGPPPGPAPMDLSIIPYEPPIDWGSPPPPSPIPRLPSFNLPPQIPDLSALNLPQLNVPQQSQLQPVQYDWFNPDPALLQLVKYQEPKAKPKSKSKFRRKRPREPSLYDIADEAFARPGKKSNVQGQGRRRKTNYWSHLY